MEQIKMMDFVSGQGANHSDTKGIARICNAAMARKAHFYVPDSVQRCTRHYRRQRDTAITGNAMSKAADRKHHRA